MRFVNFFSGGFITAIIVNQPERKLAKRTSVHCSICSHMAISENWLSFHIISYGLKGFETFQKNVPLKKIMQMKGVSLQDICPLLMFFPNLCSTCWQNDIFKKRTKNRRIQEGIFVIWQRKWVQDHYTQSKNNFRTNVRNSQWPFAILDENHESNQNRFQYLFNIPCNVRIR